MGCVICKNGQTTPGLLTVTLMRGETTVVIKGVPGEACQNCGEYYLDETTAQKMYQRAEEAVKRRVEVEIARFAA